MSVSAIILFSSAWTWKNPIRYEYSQSTNASLCKKLTNNFWWEAEAVIQKWSEKGIPLRKHKNKDIFRCLITIWSNGIARKQLNELISVKTSISNIFHFFCL